MPSELGNIPQIDNFLANLFKRSTLAEINEWDKEAQSKIDLLNANRTELESQLSKLRNKAADLKKMFTEKGFFQKLFFNRKEEFEIIADIDRLEKKIQIVDDYIVDLISERDFSPNSSDDIKNLLSELRAYRKELQLEKRSTKAEMQSIRSQARQSAANIYGSAPYERRRLRLAKEAAITPHESTVMAIEKQLIVLERKISWLGSIKK